MRLQIVVATVVLAMLVAAAPARAAVPNDVFANARLLVGVCGQMTDSNVGATKEFGEPKLIAGNPGGASIWYVWKAPVAGPVVFDTVGSKFDTLLGVWGSGGSVSSLSLVSANDDADDNGTTVSKVAFEATGGTTYWVSVDGHNGAMGPVALRWADHDAYGCPQTLTSDCGTLTQATAGATEQPGELAHAGWRGAASVWFSWTPPTSGPVSLETFGSSYQTTLEVSLPSVVSNAVPLLDGATGQPVASSDAFGTGQGGVNWFPVAGQRYRIVVDTHGPVLPKQLARLRLHWASFHARDRFGCAQVLTGFPGHVSADNIGATGERGEPEDGGVLGIASVWFEWTAPQDGTYEFDTIPSALPFACTDTLLDVWTGFTLNALTRAAFNDDAGLPSCAYSSRVSFDALRGVTYPIRVGTYNPGTGGQGTFQLNWQLWPGPANGRTIPSRGTSRVGREQRFVTTCSDPHGWKQIHTIDFSLGTKRRAGARSAVWLRFDQNHNQMELYDPTTGRWKRGTPGSRTVLASRDVRLILARSSVHGAGPSRPSVSVTWDVRFRAAAIGAYLERVAVTDDRGRATGARDVGTWRVRR